MKKILTITILIITIMVTSGCNLIKNNLNTSKICTTIYPIQFLVEKLYGSHSKIESIYPTGADLNTYKLTSKQIKEYSKNDLFIYNGLTNEKNIAKNLRNENKNLFIIDIAEGFNYKYDIKELWMSPINYLMLAKNIKQGLNDYLKSSILKEEINENYNELDEKLSLMDADLRSIAAQAKKKNTETLIVTDDLFTYLQNYGFKIISLDPDTRTKTTISYAKESIKDIDHICIIVLDNKADQEISEFITNNGLKQININSMMDKPSHNENYLTQMQTFIDQIKNNCLKD